MVDLQATLLDAGGMPALGGYTRGSVKADHVADGKANGGMPTASMGARDRPMMMASMNTVATVPDFDLPVALEVRVWLDSRIKSSWASL